MQISEMRGLRTFYARKHLLNPTKPKSLTHPFLLSLRSRETPQFYRRFNSTNRLYSSEQSEFAGDSPNIQNISSSNPGNKDKRRVWTIYDPLSGRLVAQRGVKKSHEQDLGQEPDTGGEIQLGISGLDIGVDDFEGNRSYGSAKKANSVGGSVSPANLGYGVEKFEGNKSYGDAKTASSDNGAKEPRKERDFGSARKANSIIGLGFGNAAGNKKKGKSKVSWVCADCGNTDGQWWGTCRACNNVGTMKPFSEGGSGGANSKVTGFEVSENAVRAWLPHQSGEVRPMRLTDVNRGINHSEWRIPLPGLFGNEVARVLGGGIVPGSLVLVGGDPGVGKSTLLLQIAAIIAEGRHLGKPAPVVYVSGEESVEQIGSRADRMRIGTEELFLYSSTDVEDILKKVQILSTHALVVDSIQTVYLKGVLGSAGSITQVRECTSALLRFAKTTNIPVLLAGHVTKSGDIAGPRVLEHIVDVVLYVEGEKYSSHRLLRSVKNRFGSTDELGVFEMSQAGLQAVSNPSEMFLSEQYSDSEVLAGLAVAVIMDGSRTFLIEIQALCVSGSTVLRQVNGIQQGRADMIIAVLMKQAGLKLQENAIFLNVVSGVTLSETAGDLAIAASICSSFLEFPIPNDIAFIGEIGLGGELRTVPRMEKRVNTVEKLGYKTCIVPKSAEKSLANMDYEMKIVGCKNLKEVINTVFKPH